MVTLTFVVMLTTSSLHCIVAEILCEDEKLCEDNLKVKDFVFDTKQATLNVVPDRVLKTVYINDLVDSAGSASIVDFGVATTPLDRGYEFVHLKGKQLPNSYLRYKYIPVVSSEDLVEGRYERPYSNVRLENRNYFSRSPDFHPNEVSKAKFRCGSQPGIHLKCSVVQTKIIHRIPYKAVFTHKVANCSCTGEGVLKRYDGYSFRLKVSKV